MNFDFVPQHAQPFTIEQARQLDVSTITQEISRLENSLNHLEETQTILREALADGHDQDVEDALEENDTKVMYVYYDVASCLNSC